MAKDKAEKIQIIDPKTGEIIEGTREEFQQLYNTLKDLISKANWQEAAAAIATIRKTAGPLMDAYTELQELRPYIDAELQKPEYNGATIEDLLDPLEPSDLLDLPEDSILYKVLQAARSVKQDADKLQVVSYKKTPELELTVDKMSTVFFDSDAPRPSKKEINGQISFEPIEVKYEKPGTPEISLFYSFEFDSELMRQLNLPEEIDDEDYFIATIIANSYLRGNTIVSPTKVYKDLTGDDPNSTQLAAIIDRLKKGLTTNLTINNKQVLQGWKKIDEEEAETYQEITGQLLPIIIGSEKYSANGKIVNSSIKILDLPLVFKTGRAIGQYTTIPKTLLAVTKEDGRKVRRTKRFYKILAYLIKRTAHIKNSNSKISNKILYETFYRDNKENTKRGRQAARELLFIILDHFIREDWITGYKETPNKRGEYGIEIYYDADNKKLPEKKKR